MLVLPGTDSRARQSLEGIMNGLEIVDVVIGLTLVYLLLASICSLLRERVEALLKTRAVNLERGIRELLDDPGGTGLTALLYAHPLVFGLFEGQYEPGKIKPKTGLMPVGTKLPSYIPARNFAQALLDVVARHGAPAPDAAGGPGLDLLRDAAGQLGNPMVQRMIESAVDASNGQLDQVRQNLEHWFNSAMDRLSGQYRRRSQSLILWISLLVAVVVNANTLTMVERLSVDPSLRQALVQQAGSTAKPQDGAPQWQTLGRLGLPLGWAGGWPGPSGDPLAVPPPTDQTWDTLWYYVLHPLLGLLLTAFAVSLGAPFWFDALNRFVSLRSTLKAEPTPAAPVAAPPQPPPVVQVQLPATAPAAAAPTPVAAAFEPHQWAQGNPFAGVL